MTHIKNVIYIEAFNIFLNLIYKMFNTKGKEVLTMKQLLNKMYNLLNRLDAKITDIGYRLNIFQ